MKTAQAFVLSALFAGSLIAGSSGISAEAAQRGGPNAERLAQMLERTPEADANRDGQLTAEEAMAYRNQNRAERPAEDGAADRPPAEARPARPAKPAPAFAAVAYGPHERNVLDFWQADVEKPAPLFVFIHGGGFRAGNKESVPSLLLEALRGAGIHAASINYRLTDVGPYPMQMLDGARAIQFLRTKAEEWKIDPKRIAAGGGSAGSGISQWIAFHDDLAKPDSADPIERQSSRLCCVVPMNMQSTYDPRAIREIVPGKAYEHPALLPLFGRPEGWNWDRDPIDEELSQMLIDAAPATHVTPDDPPVFILSNANAETDGNIHHPNFGRHMKSVLDKAGVPNEFHLDREYETEEAKWQAIVDFMLKHCQ